MEPPFAPPRPVAAAVAAPASMASTSAAGAALPASSRPLEPTRVVAQVLESDTVVFQQARQPSRQVGVAPMPAPAPAPVAAIAMTAARTDGSAGVMQSARSLPPQAQANVTRMTVQVEKRDGRLGFGVRHDTRKRLVVSTTPEAADSPLRIGDMLLSVNGTPLGGLAFLKVVEILKAVPTGALVFEIERSGSGPSRPVAGSNGGAVGATGRIAPPITTTTNGATTASMLAIPSAPATAHASAPRVAPAPTPSSGPMQPGTSSVEAVVAPPPRKKARPSQGAAINAGDKPPTLQSLLTELQHERAEKAGLEEKNASLRKRLQKMLIDADEVRVRARAEVQAVQEKARGDVEEMEKALMAARAELRLQDRAPDIGKMSAYESELSMYRIQLERAKKAEAERTALLTVRFSTESRLAEREARRVLDAVIEEFRAQLRIVGRKVAVDERNVGERVMTVVRDGVRRMAVLKLLNLSPDVGQYLSASFQSLDPLRHTVQYEQFHALFGNALHHEERAGLFYVGVAPMDLEFDPRTETLTLKCEWTEQHALRDLARNFRS